MVMEKNTIYLFPFSHSFFFMEIWRTENGETNLACCPSSPSCGYTPLQGTRKEFACHPLPVPSRHSHYSGQSSSVPSQATLFTVLSLPPRITVWTVRVSCTYKEMRKLAQSIEYWGSSKVILKWSSSFVLYLLIFFFYCNNNNIILYT